MNAIPNDKQAQLQESLHNETLSSVEFVMDYVQLRFNGPTLTLITEPTLQIGDRLLLWDDRDFRNELCGLITQEVELATIRPCDSIVLRFKSGTVLTVSLKDRDYVGAAAVEFDSKPEEKTWWIL